MLITSVFWSAKANLNLKLYNITFISLNTGCQIGDAYGDFVI